MDKSCTHRVSLPLFDVYASRNYVLNICVVGKMRCDKKSRKSLDLCGCRRECRAGSHATNAADQRGHIRTLGMLYTNRGSTRIDTNFDMKSYVLSS